ncbi:MAG: sulfite exporter TauE/SafE family protein [Ilumatobacteraceae bacterium]|jgi:uncharacterized membrane protein YfcA
MTAAGPAAQVDVARIATVGLAAGMLSGVFGVGGGILVVPALVLFVKMDQRIAHGTSLAAVLPISMASLVTYWVQGHVDWPVAAWLAIGAVAGAVLGTKLLHVLPHRTLAIGFSALLLVTAARLFVAGESAGRDALDWKTGAVLVAVGLVTGILAGLLGVGGGVVMVPAMMMILSEASVVAKGTSVAVIIPTAIMGTWRNRRNNNADLKAAAIVGFGGIASAVVGGWIAGRMDETLSNVLFAILLVVVATRLLVDVRRSDH